MSKPKDRYPLKCKICYVGFSSILGLRRHYEERHTSSTRHCNNCGANYPVNGFHRC